MAVFLITLKAPGYETKELDVEIPDSAVPKLLQFASDEHPNLYDEESDSWAPATQEESLDRLVTGYIELMLHECERRFSPRPRDPGMSKPPLGATSKAKQELARKAKQRVLADKERQAAKEADDAEKDERHRKAAAAEAAKAVKARAKK